MIRSPFQFGVGVGAGSGRPPPPPPSKLEESIEEDEESEREEEQEGFAALRTLEKLPSPNHFKAFDATRHPKHSDKACVSSDTQRSSNQGFFSLFISPIQESIWNNDGITG
ncbi:hypothetical protein Peur_031552 [Populus x canadensis]